MRLAPIALTGLAILALGGCASGEAPRERRAEAPARPPIVIRPLFPADYMAAASSIDLYEIRSSRAGPDPRRRTRASAISREP